MDQKTITGQAFRVLTDAANGVFHRISLWTHADDVEMKNGDSLTTAMEDKYNVSSGSITSIVTPSDIPKNTAGTFMVDDDIGRVVVDNVWFFAGNLYTYFSFYDSMEQTQMVLVSHPDKTYDWTLSLLRKDRNGWHGSNISSEENLSTLQQYLETQLAYMDEKKYGVDKVRRNWQSLDNIIMNTAGSWVLTSKDIGYYDNLTNITTYILPGEYFYLAYENTHGHKSIVLFSNVNRDDNTGGLHLGGGYYCSNTGMTGAPWIITRILSATDFSTDGTGLREQIVSALTGQLWPVGAIYINLTRENPGSFLGGTWNLITEGILTAIKGSPEQAGYHQRDLYKAVKDEDRGEHLYGVFAWQRIA